MRRLVLGTLTALALVVTGCGGDQDPAPPTTTTATGTTPTGSPSTSPSGSPSTSPTEPGVAPAAGPLVTGDTVTVNAPTDWPPKTPTRTATGGNVNGPDARYNLLLGDVVSPAPGATLDELVTLVQGACCYDPPLERVTDTTVAGQPAFHLSGKDNIFGRWADEYSFPYGDRLIQITVSTPLGMAQPKRDALAVSVLASVDLNP